MAEDCPFRPSGRPARYNFAQAGISNHQPASLSVPTHFAYWLLGVYNPTLAETPRVPGRGLTWSPAGSGRTLTWLPLGLEAGSPVPPRRGAWPHLGYPSCRAAAGLWNRLCAAAALHARLSGHGGSSQHSACLERQSCWEYAYSVLRYSPFE